MSSRVIKFLLIGGGGFIVDYSVFNAFVNYMPEFAARIISIFFAIVFTWSLNRNFTFDFKEQNKLKEFVKYFLASKFSVAVNYGVFLFVLTIFNFSYFDGYVVATAISATSNYLLYRSI